MRKSWIILRQSFIDSTAYGSVTLVWILVAMLEILVPLVIWLSATPVGGSFGGFTKSQLLAYYALMTLVGNFTFWWLNFKIEEDIRSGDLSNILLKPISSFRYRLLNQLADKAFSFLARIPIFVVVFIFFGEVIFTNFTLLSLILSIIATLLGSLIYMLISAMFGLFSFWITSTRGFISIYFFSVYLLSGELAPLAFYPTWFRDLTSLLPYRYVLSFPIELILGKLSPTAIVTGFIVEASWLLGLAFLVNLLWRRGLRLYQAYGK